MTYWKASLAVAACFMAVPAQASTLHNTPVAEDAAVLATDDMDHIVHNDAAPSPFGDRAKKQLADMTAMIEQWLGVKDLPAIDNNRLIAARAATAPLTARASIEKMFDTAYGRLFQSFSAISLVENRETALRAMGVPEDKLASVSDADLARVTAIINPNIAAQQQHMTTTIRPLVNAAFDVWQPAIHEGLARGYARRFSVAELAEISAFFTTKVGADFAAEQLALQANPEVIVGMLRSSPELVDRVEKLVPAMEAGFKTMPKSRDIQDLSNKEIQQIAAILKVDHKLIKAKLTEDKATAREAENALEAVIADDTPYEAYDRANWSAQYKEAVEAHEAATAEAQRKATEAEMAAIQDASQRLSRTAKP